MKKMMLNILLGVVLLAGISACQPANDPGTIKGSGKLIGQAFQINDVHQVELATVGDLIIYTGQEETLVISTEDNLMPYFTSNVSGGKLVIGTKNGINLRPTKPILFTLFVKSLEGIANNSSGNINAPELKASNFAISLSSTGHIQVTALTADRLNLDISSTGSVFIDGGKITDQTIDISSSGNYYAQKVTSQTATVNLSSSGSANIQVSDTINATLSSSGNVNYTGAPKVNSSSSSSGKVIPVP